MLLFDLIEDKNVAIVGPSSYLKGKKLGNLIDSYDIVIKINRFESLPSEDFGYKVDILFSNFYVGPPHTNIKEVGTKLIMAAHHIVGDDINHTRQYNKSKSIFTDIPHELFPFEAMDPFLKDKCNKGGWKTSGFFILCLLFNHLNLMNSLTLFGVDFCFNEYLEKYQIFYNPHNFTMEREYFKEIYSKYKHLNKIHIHDQKFFAFLESN